MNYPGDLINVAKKVVWFQSPEETLENKIFFLSHVMTYGMIEDITTVKKYYNSKDFIEVLEHPIIGIFDSRSWAYWHVALLKHSAPALPTRKF